MRAEGTSVRTWGDVGRERPVAAVSDGPSIRQQAQSLFTFLREVVALRGKTVRSVDDSAYELVKWLADIPDVKECFCVAGSEPDPAGAPPERWIEIRKPQSRPHPAIPVSLRPWLDAVEVADSGRPYPELRDEALPGVSDLPNVEPGGGRSGVVSLEAMPQVLDEWERYVDTSWQPWAERDRGIRAVQDLYDDLFSAHQTLQTRAEEFELLMGFGALSWRTPSGHSVKRHLITTRCELTFDPARGRVVLGPSPEGLQFNLEQDMLDVDEQPKSLDAGVVRQNLEDVDGSFWFNESLHTVLREWVHSASSTGEYRGSDGHPVPVGDAMVVSWAPAIILRKRTDRPILDMYDRILDLMEGGCDIPPGVEALVSTAEPASDGVEPLEDEGLGDPADSVYFPLESNAEQFRIVERLATAQGLLVQGPPGTGKSHTIANLIAHLLASGQRVLVTSQTPRALRVLKDKMPPEISDLCVLLIGDDRAAMNDLERSVQAITDRYNSWDIDENRQRISSLESQLDEARKREAGLRGDLVTLREGEVTACAAVAGVYSGTLQTIAEALAKERDRCSWLATEGAALSGAHAPITDFEAGRLLALLRSLDISALSALDLASPNLAEVPEVALFESMVTRRERATTEVAALSPDGASGAPAAASAASDDLLRAAVETLEDLRRVRQACLSCGDPWCEEAARQVLSGRANAWLELEQFTRASLAWIDALPESVRAATVTGLGDREPITVRADAQAVLDHLNSGGTLGNRVFRPKVVKERWYLVEHVRVDGVGADSPTTLATLVQWCDLSLSLDRLLAMWTPLVQAIPSDRQLRIASFRDYLGIAASVAKLHEGLDSARNALATIEGVSQPEWQDQAAVAATLRVLRAAIAQKQLSEAEEAINAARDAVRSSMPSGAHHPDADSLLKAMDDRDLAGFDIARGNLERRALLAADAQVVRDLSQRLESRAPSVLAELTADPSDPCWDARFGGFEAAWRWRQALRWLEDSTRPGAMQSMLSDLESVAAHIRMLVTQLAEAKAWGHCFEHLTEHERKHLMAWMQATRRIGKGTGKNAPRYRREARANMEQCRSAIPAWVMPIYRVAESITPGSDQFDVVVVDEASQSGIDALFLQFLGKKMLIVGDNKQIAPEYIGTKSQAVQELRERYIRHLPVSSEFTNESSLFDQAAIHYRSSIRLKEHFRCMPEIIQFSNRLSYPNDPLIPLRQYGADRLDPIRRVHVPTGYQEGTSGRAINRPEADAVVRAIVGCCGDARYDGLTMGVISLLGEAQARLIERALIRELGPSEMEGRRLVCGDAYSFQGDERHVMFLSMVSAVGDGHRVGALTGAKDERRFNVAASRAKDQLWLFHSVLPNDLNPECMRSKLLQYCMNPLEDGFIRGSEISVDDLRRTAMGQRRLDSQPDPFDSWFEVDVFLRLCGRGFRVAPQHEVAGYCIDLVVEGGQSRLAVECDGDHWHGPEQYEADIARQRQLERCGWTFWRVRGSEYYRDPDAALADLWAMLERHGIRPPSWQAPDGAQDGDPEPETEPSDVEGSRGAQPLAPSEPGADIEDAVAGVGDVDAVVTDVPSDGQPHPVDVPKDRGLYHPVTGTMPLGSSPTIEEYAFADIDISEPVEDLAEVSAEQLAAWLVQVVDAESPIRLHEAARRIARAAGVRRVGHVIITAFERAARGAVDEGALVTCGEFLWSPRRTKMTVRDRVTLPSADRKIDLIADEEIEWAICAVLSSVGRAEEDEVPRQAMRALGFERTSREAEERVWAALARGVEAGAFIRLGTAVAFVGVDGVPLSMGISPRGDVPSRFAGVVPPYGVAQPIVELGDSQFHELSREYLANALQGVVAAESPIHVSEASRRLANAAGLERVGHRIQSAVSAACLELERAGLIERRGDFLWYPGVKLAVRDRSDAPASVRDIKMIAPEEIRQAAQVIGAAEMEDENEAVMAVARVLGFRRTGKDLQSVIGSLLASDLGVGD